ncbi:uncharacterized protein M421DRAFT_383733 [Didymella exigua CBS 183.55]|uniref:Uncharacterized protein n=1 Tax=Didymella exigua CBS 183.55 TaxID=1150837 RepID=A0A6A5RUS7_9PLEO|nr:uncharacterized protein M421DRAFT_383733 [Didymella exigua CBS 183.55]KAF1930056.1 hypothetical protein M421DRAFT_383733 [Didymella exigua CBS 183.55]
MRSYPGTNCLTTSEIQAATQHWMPCVLILLPIYLQLPPPRSARQVTSSTVSTPSKESSTQYPLYHPISKPTYQGQTKTHHFIRKIPRLLSSQMISGDLDIRIKDAVELWVLLCDTPESDGKHVLGWCEERFRRCGEGILSIVRWCESALVTLK